MKPYSRISIVIAGSTAVCLAMLGLLFYRLHQGQLFLLALARDQPASQLEVARAREDAVVYFLPACLVVMVGFFLVWRAWNVSPHSGSFVRMMAATWQQNRWASAIFVAATIVDFATTLVFFHRDGVDTELHPGVRIASLAIGRTVGPVVAKLLQATGVFLIASVLPRWSSWVLLAASLAYAAGAIVNLLGGLPAQ